MTLFNLPPNVLYALSFLFCTCFGAIFIFTAPPHKRRLLWGKRYVVPPGPVGQPILGSLLEWLQVRRKQATIPWLARQAHYGEMTTIHMGTRTWVLLNSPRVVNEIIAKRTAKTHERPFFPIASELVSRNRRFFLFKTKDWREGRRLLHHLLLGADSKEHGRAVEQASLGLLQAYLDEPESWYMHNYRFPLSVIYGLLTSTSLERSSAQLNDLQRVTSTFLTAINSSPIDFFPQLSKLPVFLQLWRPHWKSLGTFHFNVFTHWWKELKQLDNPDVKPSFLRDEILKQFSGREEQAMYLSLFVLSAGADNPRMTINAWVMACLAYPDKMDKARKEIESVCGEAHRLPVLDDLPRLPYTAAVVKEVLRWRPTVPLVPQRVLVEDIEFEGYQFPAGTEFLVNSVSVCSYGYERPQQFYPEHWLESDDGGGVMQDLWQFAFSAGVRSCVGYKLAQKELFIAFSRLLYCFNFSPAGPFKDTELNAFVPGEPFPVGARIRSEKYEQLIRRLNA